VVGYAPGGGSDIMGRLIAPQITEAMGQQVIVENRPGVAQNIAAEYVAKSPADGYTLFMSSAALGVNVSLYPKLNYDPVKDFAPVAVFATSANLLLVHPSLPVRSVKEFIAFVKKNPGKLNFSSSGSGSTQHLSGEMLKLMIKGDFTHIPYKGTGPSLVALASGEVDFSFSNIPAAQPLMHKFRVLAITSEKRSPLLPDLPTMAEAGLPGFVTQTWYGVLVPAGTPANVIGALNSVIVKAVQKESFRKRLAQMGADPIAETPEYFRKMLLEEIERWSKVVKASGIKP
jgi:tripartite-type tricarboxylate transporter receptor subunit TctC